MNKSMNYELLYTVISKSWRWPVRICLNFGAIPTNIGREESGLTKASAAIRGNPYWNVTTGFASDTTRRIN
jgi:hypothetical protein